MALMTGEQYIESIRKMHMQVYMFGKKVESPVDDPILRPSLNSVRMTYDLAQKPEYQDLMTATSNLTGKRVNRFTNIHQSTEDLVKKVKMQRLLGQQTAACFQRCVGMDAFNAVYSTTYEIDQKYGTTYHENFKKFAAYVQENDLTVDGAMTDPKGDRSRAPHAQEDPDLFLRVVERRPDGIVVRGAKAHQTGALNSHEIIIMPTISMGPEDKDYAVSFAVPMDAEGIFMIIGRQSCDTRKLEGSELDVGNAEFGGVEALVVFEDVFVPNDRIFLCGETEFAGMMVERFAGYHRQSYGGCKVGVGDVLIGAAAVAADYNGCAKASHIKDKQKKNTMDDLNGVMNRKGFQQAVERILEQDKDSRKRGHRYHHNHHHPLLPFRFLLVGPLYLREYPRHLPRAQLAVERDGIPQGIICQVAESPVDVPSVEEYLGKRGEGGIVPGGIHHISDCRPDKPLYPVRVITVERVLVEPGRRGILSCVLRYLSLAAILSL